MSKAVLSLPNGTNLELYRGPWLARNTLTLFAMRRKAQEADKLGEVAVIYLSEQQLHPDRVYFTIPSYLCDMPCDSPCRERKDNPGSAAIRVTIIEMCTESGHDLGYGGQNRGFVLLGSRIERPKVIALSSGLAAVF